MQIARLRWPRVGLAPPFTIPCNGGHSGCISDKPYIIKIHYYSCTRQIFKGKEGPLDNPDSSISAPIFETLLAVVSFLRAAAITQWPLSDPQQDTPASKFGRSS